MKIKSFESLKHSVADVSLFPCFQFKKSGWEAEVFSTKPAEDSRRFLLKHEFDSVVSLTKSSTVVLYDDFRPPFKEILGDTIVAVEKDWNKFDQLQSTELAGFYMLDESTKWAVIAPDDEGYWIIGAEPELMKRFRALMGGKDYIRNTLQQKLPEDVHPCFLRFLNNVYERDVMSST